MFLSKRNPRSRTVVARLMLWYGIICTVFCIISFIIVSTLMARSANKRIDKMLSDEVREFVGIYEKNGLQGLREEIEHEESASGADSIFGRMLASDRTVILSSDIQYWQQIEHELKRIKIPRPGKIQISTLYNTRSPFYARMAELQSPDGYIMQFGFSLQKENRIYNRMLRIMLFSSSVTIAFTIFSGWIIARQAMSGVRRVTKVVSHIQRDSLDQLVPFRKEGREIDDLVEAFNGMLARIKQLIHELKEVTDNVAHDLRSPITRMRGIAETTLTGTQDVDSYREAALTVIEECDRLTELINTALEIAGAESGLIEIDRDRLELNPLFENAVELFSPVAEEKQISLTAEIPEEPLLISGDKSRIQRVIANLLDNAIKYTPAGGSVRLSVKKTDGSIRFEVSDTGIGIDPKELEKIFDRYFRGEKSRSSQGNGLGLSLARTIIQAHRGTISAANKTNGGCTMTITLPAA